MCSSHMQIRVKRITVGSGLIMLLGVLALMAFVFICCINLGNIEVCMPICMGTVPTPSMFPLINQGDMILFDKYKKFDDIVLGDIIVFDKPGKRIVHMVINDTTDSLITHGINNPKNETEFVTETEYVGYFIFPLRYGSYILVLLGGLYGGFCLGRFVCAKQQKAKLKKDM